MSALSLTDKLIRVGLVCEEYRKSGRSLLPVERKWIDRIRSEARVMNYSEDDINRVEMEAWRSNWSNLGTSVEFELVGVDEFGLRSYNVYGHDVPNGSTLGCIDLMKRLLPPDDLSLLGFIYHTVHEVWVIGKLKMLARL